MAIVGREVIGRQHGKTKELLVEEWGGNVRIRQLSHNEVVVMQGMATDAVDKDSQSVKDRAKLTRFNFELIRLSWVDEAGNLVLTNGEDDYNWLVSEPNDIIKKLTNEMAKFSGLQDESSEDAEKN